MPSTRQYCDPPQNEGARTYRSSLLSIRRPFSPSPETAQRVFREVFTASVFFLDDSEKTGPHQLRTGCILPRRPPQPATEHDRRKDITTISLPMIRVSAASVLAPGRLKTSVCVGRCPPPHTPTAVLEKDALWLTPILSYFRVF